MVITMKTKGIFTLILTLALAIVIFSMAVCAVENTGNTLPGSFTTTEGKWNGNKTVNLIPTPTLPVKYNSVVLGTGDGENKSLWQAHWNNVMVAAGWGSEYISGDDDALQIYATSALDGSDTFAIRPCEIGVDGTNANLGGAGDNVNDTAGGIFYTITLTDEDIELAKTGTLYVQAFGEFYRQKDEKYAQSIHFEFYDLGGRYIANTLFMDNWSANTGAADGYLARSSTKYPVPATTKYIRFWFSNNGSGNARKSVKNMQAYLSIGKASYFTLVSENHCYVALSVNNRKKNWDGTLEYSVNGIDWKTFDGTTEIRSHGSYDMLYLRGKGNTVITGTNDAQSGWIVQPYLSETDTIKYCSGNIMTLFDYENPDKVVMGDYALAYLFSGCTKLKECPALPAATLSKGCYKGMFEGCTALTQLPELKATTLADECYKYMFKDCTGITLYRDGKGNSWSIPKNVKTTDVADWSTGMFANTGGRFLGAPEVGELFYYADSDNAIDDLTKAGKISVHLSESAYVIVASYNDGVLIDTWYQLFEPGEYTYTTNIDVKGATYVQAFMWKNLGNCKPICDTFIKYINKT